MMTIDYKKAWKETEFDISKNKEWDKFYTLSTHNKLTPQEVTLKNIIGKNQKILDVGCSYGRLMRLFPKAIGIDVSEEMLKRNPFKKRIQVMDVTKGLRFKDNSFDAIICSYVLNHMEHEDIIKTLLECNRLLKENGHIFISARNRIDWIWQMKLIYWKLIGTLSLVHSRNLTIRKLGKYLNKLKFDFVVFHIDKTEIIIEIQKLK